MSRPLSQHPIVYFLGLAAGAIAVGFGINVFIRPHHAISFFEIEQPSGVDGKDFFDLIIPVYGIRNIALGGTVLAAGYRKDHKLMGWNILSFAVAAVVDGIVCWRRGHGQGRHWGYAPQLAILASVLMGAFDRFSAFSQAKKTN